MPAPCVTCAHPDREAIDRALVTGESMRSLAKRYGMHRTSLARHSQAHLSPALVRVVAEREEAGPRSVLDRLEELETEVRGILATAKEDGRANISLAAVRELRGILDTIARITGELDERPQVALVLAESPEWQGFREALLDILADYPPELGQRLLHQLQAVTDAHPPAAGVLVGKTPALSTPGGAS